MFSVELKRGWKKFFHIKSLLFHFYYTVIHRAEDQLSFTTIRTIEISYTFYSISFIFQFYLYSILFIFHFIHIPFHLYSLSFILTPCSCYIVQKVFIPCYSCKDRVNFFFFFFLHVFLSHFFPLFYLYPLFDLYLRLSISSSSS